MGWFVEYSDINCEQVSQILAHYNQNSGRGIWNWPLFILCCFEKFILFQAVEADGIWKQACKTVLETVNQS